MSAVRHLYVHLPFCASRCGYCDFVTVVGRGGEHDAYVDALLGELELERASLAEPLETVYLGGGTPTFTARAGLERLLGRLPAAAEVTVEANPETVDAGLAELLARAGVNRVSLGAQTFDPRLLGTLERRAGPDDVVRAFRALRVAGFDNLSLDLIYGIPGQRPDGLARDLDAALALEPEHVSAYELEAKLGTRFAHAHGAELARQADALEPYFEQVVETLTGAGYRWYETANFCRREARDLRSRHNLGYWLGHDYLGLGIGAVSTLGPLRRRNAPSLARYVDALRRGAPPPREHERLAPEVKRVERLMLGLRLDRPLELDAVRAAIDDVEVERLVALGLVEVHDDSLTLSERGRFLGGAVTARLLV